MATKYQKKKQKGDERFITGDKLAFNRARADLKRREDEASTSREENSLFREGEIAIARHEKLTGVNRADWDLIMASQIAACEEITKARGYD